MVDQLAQEYAGQSVVFLEYDVDAGYSPRYSLWWAAFRGSQAILPLVMVDSGNQISYGHVDYHSVYKTMVDASLIRPPEAEMQAFAWRDGNKVNFYVQLQNLTDITLSPSNWATIHGIVYEDIRVGVTDRYVRTTVSTIITNLTPKASAQYRFETADLNGVNWDNLHYIVLVDYKPPESPGAFDMLKAVTAVSLPAPFYIKPNPHTFLIDPAKPTTPSAILDIKGVNFLSWSATENISWLAISPTNGDINTKPIITVDTALLSPGMQQGVITFTTTDTYFSENVTVGAYYGQVKYLYLPSVKR